MSRKLLVDFSKAILGIRTAVLIGVELLGEFVVGLLDLCLRGVSANAQNLWIIECSVTIKVFF